MEKERIIEIINELLEHLGMNAKQLSDSLGYTRPSWIYEVLNPQKKNGISKRVASAICEKYDDINYEYLMTGEGNLTKSASSPISVSGDQSGNINSPGSTTAAGLDKLITVVSDQSKQIGELIKTNQDLINIITNLSKQ